MNQVLTNADLNRAARTLNCEVALIRAVDQVESNGNGYTKGGDLVLRFESAWFKHYTGKTVLGSNRTAYLNAEAINAHAAKLSTSWGRYQIMGFNHQICGYATVEAMIAAFLTSEGKQLDAFVSFVIGKKIDDDLRQKNWKGFAYVYNGSGYAIYGYDTKLAAAYQSLKDQLVPDTSAKVVVKKKANSGCGACSCSASEQRCTTSTRKVK